MPPNNAQAPARAQARSTARQAVPESANPGGILVASCNSWSQEKALTGAACGISGCLAPIPPEVHDHATATRRPRHGWLLARRVIENEQTARVLLLEGMRFLCDMMTRAWRERRREKRGRRSDRLLRE